MLEEYSYINLSCSNVNIEERVETLFISNNQQKRYTHICSVVKQIDSIAMQYDLDREKCRIAAMLHDISTLINWEDMLLFAKQNNWEICEAEELHPFLLHQRISEVIAQEDFEITDCDVLDAIAFHTSLCENASPYQMALFVADKLAWSNGGIPPYYEKMSEALGISLEASCYVYVKYMENEGKMASVHVEWTKAVRWLKDFVMSN